MPQRPARASLRAGRGIRRYAVHLLLPPLVLAVLLSQLDVSAAHGGPLPWAAALYPLVTAAALPALGALGDRHGRRCALTGSIGLLLAGTVLGAAARDPGPLLAARAVQGLGAGGATAGVVALVAERVPARERGPYLGALVGATALALTTGRLAHAPLAAHLGRHWVPWATVPLGALALALATALPPPRRGRARADYRHAALLLLAVTTLVHITTHARTTPAPAVNGVVHLTLSATAWLTSLLC